VLPREVWLFLEDGNRDVVFIPHRRLLIIDGQRGAEISLEGPIGFTPGTIIAGRDRRVRTMNCPGHQRHLVYSQSYEASIRQSIYRVQITMRPSTPLAGCFD